MSPASTDSTLIRDSDDEGANRDGTNRDASRRVAAASPTDDRQQPPAPPAAPAAAAAPATSSGSLRCRPGPLGDDSLSQLDLTDHTVRPGPHVVVANAGDHAAIHQFLVAVFQGPTHDAFAASLDDPFYEPSDRLLMKRGTQIVSHLQLTKRVMHFGSLRIPSSGLCWLATLPEFRQQGYAQRLLKIADQLMIEDGSVVGILRTKQPFFFRSAGWALCGRHSLSFANARNLLAQLSADQPYGGSRKLNIRPWRQVELPALMRIYRENLSRVVGAIERTEPYWRWMMSRKGFENIFVAIDGPDKLELDGVGAPIVGYAITRDEEILELMTTSSHPRASRQLLARACREAIERDRHSITLHAPPNHPLHELFLVAGGEHRTPASLDDEVYMVRILDPTEFLRMLCPELHQRTSRSMLSRPCELGLVIEGDRHQLVISRRSVKVTGRKIGRSYLRCNRAEFTRLALGHTDAADSMREGRLEASSRIAADIATVLFPRLPLWRSPVDDLLE